MKKFIVSMAVVAAGGGLFLLLHASIGHNHSRSLAAQNSEATIDMAGSAFAPETIRIKRGTRVAWVNTDKTRHNAVADDGSFKTPLIGKGESASVTFREEGTFTYYCGPHPFMRGTIIVEDN